MSIMQIVAIKSLLLWIWNQLWNFPDYYYLLFDSIYRRVTPIPEVVGVRESIQHMLHTKCSVCRYGDGEMKFILGSETWFQKKSPLLRKRLTEILSSDEDNVMICIPNKFGVSKVYTDFENKHWKKNISHTRRTWYKYLNRKKIYYDAFISRCYMPYKDKTLAKEYFGLWKQIWDGRDLLIIEGEKTRLGVGNTLFDNVKSIRRILCPNTNAFDYYEQVISRVKDETVDKLILIAIGPTATVMAFDLAQLGYQAIDIGHLDIEYEWFLMKAQTKVPVNNKFVNEAGAGKGVGDNNDKKYLAEIICNIAQDK